MNVNLNGILINEKDNTISLCFNELSIKDVVINICKEMNIRSIENLRVNDKYNYGMRIEVGNVDIYELADIISYRVKKICNISSYKRSSI